MIKLETLSQDQREAVQTLLMEAGYPMTCETFAVWLLQNKMAAPLEDVEGLELTSAIVGQIPIAITLLHTQKPPTTQPKTSLDDLRKALDFMLNTEPYRVELEHLPPTEWGPYIDAYLPTVLEVVQAQ